MPTTLCSSHRYVYTLHAPAPEAGRSLARQPILDAKGRVVAYELLFRTGVASEFDGPGELASQTMVDNMLMYGLGKLTAGLPAFINCTAETLSSSYLGLLPPSLTVLEVLETVRPTREVISDCVGLRRKGFRIALDDFIDSRSLGPLIEIADFIKIIFRSTSFAQRRELISTLNTFKGTYLAEKVETLEEYATAKEEGFDLFQGFYFFKPALLRRRSVPPNRLVHLHLLRTMQAEPLDLIEIAGIVKSEPSLAYRLLRFVNSAGFSMRPGMTSIKNALLAVGDDQFRRMATLAVAVELNSGSSPEILRVALIRARFCELVAPLLNLKSTEQYLLGLFSLLDAMFQMTMENAIAPLSLAEPIREALLGAECDLRSPLTWLESHERGDFAQCDEFALSRGFEGSLFEKCLATAILWADQMLAEN